MWAVGCHHPAGMTVLPRELLPDNSTVDPDGRLSIAGCDVVDLAGEHGTPLFVYDEDHLRTRCREAMRAFPDGVAYATKAFLCGAMAELAIEEGLSLDVATGGEIHVALRSGADPDRLIFHGNNKSTSELAYALEAGVARVVIDSAVEMDSEVRLRLVCHGVHADGAAGHRGRQRPNVVERP